MDFKELLKNVGVADDVAAKIMDGMKENKLYLSGEENLDVRYSKLKTDHDTQAAQYAEAQKLIEQLKKDSAASETAKGKIAEYETQIKSLQEQNAQIMLDAALKDALHASKAKADDFDYLIFRMKQDNEIKMGEDGKIKGIDDIVKTLKTAHPGNFEAENGKKIDTNPLPNGKQENGMTKEAFAKMGYAERVKLLEESPEVYREMTKEG